MAEQRTPNTRLAYRADLEAFGRWCVQRDSLPLHVDAATFGEFEAARRAAGDSPSTLRRRRASLASFYRFAVDSAAIDVNPVDAANRVSLAAAGPSATDVLERAAVEAYMATAAALDPRLEALVSLLVFDGLKLGEALAIDVGDVSGRPPKVSLVLRRRGAEQRVQLTDSTARAVRRCAGRRPDGPLFVSARAGAPSVTAPRLTRFGADHLIRQLTAPGAARVTSNALRRYYFPGQHGRGRRPAGDRQRHRAGRRARAAPLHLASGAGPRGRRRAMTS